MTDARNEAEMYKKERRMTKERRVKRVVSVEFSSDKIIPRSHIDRRSPPIDMKAAIIWAKSISSDEGKKSVYQIADRGNFIHEGIFNAARAILALTERTQWKPLDSPPSPSEPLAAPGQKQGQTNASNRYWVMERYSPAQYYVGGKTPNTKWSTEILAAMRFESEAMADKHLYNNFSSSEAMLTPVRICEHMDCGDINAV